MFTTLDDQIKRSGGNLTTKERLLRYTVVLAIAGTLFGALYIAVG
jgi:hypothetical protein